jgi:DNA-directed RNA polymerase subunit M/transcription elongation factor TFIIS
MGFFSELFKNNIPQAYKKNVEGELVYIPPKDDRQAICPSCSSLLEKIPGSKTKCKSCGEYMFVRTEPHSRTRVVVNAKQAEEIDDEIAKINGTFEERIAEKNRKLEIEIDLTKKFKGKKPSNEDINWRILVQDTLSYAKKHWWASYALNNARKGDEFFSRGKVKEAIGSYIVYTYLELNGAQDFGEDAASRKILTELGFKEFDPEKSKFPQSGVEQIIKFAKILKLNTDSLESIFYENCKSIKIGVLPISPELAWEKLKSEIILDD